MTIRRPWDGWAAELDSLETHDVSAERAERIRARCLASLADRQRVIEKRPAWRPSRRAWLAPAFAVGISVIYMAAAIGTTLQLARVLRAARTLVP